MPTPEQFRARKALSDLVQTSPRRVHDLVRTAIREGVLQPDDRLIEHFLVREMATSRNAVREALQMLASEGLVRRERREGTTVVRRVIRIPLDDIVSRVAPEGFGVRRLDDRVVPSTQIIRTSLQTDAAVVGVIEHLFTCHGEAIGIRVAYYRREVTQPTGWETCPDLNTAFLAVFGLPLGRVDTHIDSFACDGRTSRMLEVPIGSPTLVKEQTLYDSAGTPQEFAYSHYRSDRVTFVVTGT